MVEFDRKDKRDLDLIVDFLFETAFEASLTWAEMAAASGLSRTTIENLGHHKTIFPQWRTIVRLARALGVDQIPLTRQKAIKIHWTPQSFGAYEYVEAA